MNTFVRKDFYIQPPPKNADKQIWEYWLLLDDKAARQDKAIHTRAANKEAAENLTAPDIYAQQSLFPAKIGGVWKQTSTGINAAGEDEVEKVLVQAPTQDRSTIPRGIRGKRKHHNRRRKYRQIKAHRLLSSHKA
jgi:hypothetical protein